MDGVCRDLWPPTHHSLVSDSISTITAFNKRRWIELADKLRL
jgi:hypothetical protein